ncbi:tRNA pseudouridine synthase-like 1, partial [Dufourea novaeangliae]
MQKYFMKFSYIGTQYRGLQRNGIKSDYIIRDVDTIQGAIENAFTTLIPKCTNLPMISVSSRTDAGVHALCNAADIRLSNAYNCLYNPSEVLRQINGYLMKCHHDIRLLDFIPVTDEFSARRVARSRTYIYRFMTPKQLDEHRIPIIEKVHTYHLRSETFDIERLQRGTQLFMGIKNFTSFSGKSHAPYPINYVRKLNKLTIEKGQPFMPLDPLSQNYEFWNITCSSKSFLYNQVRRIVTALLNLSIGNLTEKEITCMLQVPGHHNWNPHLHVVPPWGLYLANIEYSQEDIDNYSIKYKLQSPN